MPILRIKDIANMSVEDRENKLIDLRAELSRIRTLVSAGGAVEDPTRIRELRKAIAQILTIQNENKLGIRAVPTPPEKKPEKPEKKAKAKAKEKEAENQEQPSK